MFKFVRIIHDIVNQEFFTSSPLSGILFCINVFLLIRLFILSSAFYSIKYEF